VERHDSRKRCAEILLELAAAEARGSVKQKSIVLVTVDCLRADHVGFMGYRQPTTPFLDALAKESFIFPSAIVAGAPTYYSLPAVLASRYPLALGRDVVGIAPGEVTLQSTLRQSGYATGAYSAANPYISSRFGYEQGFDKFCDFPNGDPIPASEGMAQGCGNGWASRLNQKVQRSRSLLGPLGVIYDELYFHYCQRITPVPDSLDTLRRFPASDSIVDHACSWLASIGNAPFFLWLHLMDPHAPYYPKSEAMSLMGREAITPDRARYINSFWNRSDVGSRRLARYREEALALYDAGVRWVDAQLARLIDTLRQANLWENCIFALTADHGEEFLEHGGRYHPPLRLMEELIHVPLLLRVPGVREQRVSDVPFSLLDLAPTLLEAAEITIPSDFRGTSRWPHIRQGVEHDSVAITECVAGCANPFHRKDRLGPRVLSIREKRFKLILNLDSVGEWLYDLEADPGEQAPLAANAQKTVRRGLLEIAREHLRNSARSQKSKQRLRARLRDLRLEWGRSYPQRVAI
jgi:arylsulfatase A-like enzyme